MKGYLTSYAGLFNAQPGGAPAVGSIEVPLIQRDYAQGRLDPQVAEIRASFLEVLLDAVAGGEPAGLDLRRLPKSMDVPAFERHLAHLRRDFRIEVDPGKTADAYRVGDFKAFVGQDDHCRHAAFLKPSRLS